MAAPTADDMKWRPGADGVPTNDTDPIGGAIDTGEELVADADGQWIAAGEADDAGGSSRVHYGVGYISNEEGAGGSLTLGKLCLANGGKLMPSLAQISILDPTDENDGLELVVAGFVAGAFATETIQIDAGSAETVALFDSGSHWWVQTLDGAAIAGVDGVDDLVVKAGVTEIGVMRAPGTLWPTGCQTVGSIYSLAAATNVNATMSAANRLTVPTATGGVSSYVSGVLLDDGTDERLTVGTLADADYKGIALRRTIPAGMRAPDGGMPHVLWLTGTANA